MTSWSRFDLGVGVIATAGVDLSWAELDGLVDVVEVEPQTLWGDGQRLDRAALAWLRSLHRPLLSHGVGFPVGGTVAPDSAGVRASAASARELDAVHWSEHLSFNRAGGGAVRHAGYLLPPMPTTECVAAAVSHIERFQAEYDRPFLVETPANYLQPLPGDLTDGQFVAQIAERADCGILLDLHNIWANELNGRQPVAGFLSELPLERVWEVHLAGGCYLDSFYLDAHVGGIAEPLLELAAQVVPRLPRVRAILFEAVPESIEELGADGLAAQLDRLHALVRLPEVACVDGTFLAGGGASLAAGVAGEGTAAREAELLAFTTRASAELSGGDPGAAILRHLTDQARLSLLVSEFSSELRELLISLGRQRTDELLEEFLASTPASAWPREQCAAFAGWLAERSTGGTVAR